MQHKAMTKDCFLHISLTNAGTSEVEFCEYTCLLRLLKHFRYLLQGIMVFYCHFILSIIINTRSEFTTFVANVKWRDECVQLWELPQCTLLCTLFYAHQLRVNMAAWWGWNKEVINCIVVRFADVHHWPWVAWTVHCIPELYCIRLREFTPSNLVLGYQAVPTIVTLCCDTHDVHDVDSDSLRDIQQDFRSA